ncbi:MAG TPA: tetratricopeptide repeat protein [Gallionella sp.]|nr:tetratricopeptide repeat protein [Gallionella sp.]
MKLGRNDPCSCGSGKKYKNCCLGKPLFRPAQLKAPTPDQIRVLDEMFIAGRFAELENHSHALLKQFPDSGIVWKLFGLSLQLQGKDALFALQKAAELSPNDAEAHGNLAAILRARGQFGAAVESGRRALLIRPDFAEALNNLGVALQGLGQLDEAVKSYRRALEIKPDFVEVHNNLGGVLKELGRFDEAVASYRSVLQLNPDFAEAHNNLGLVFKDIGQFNDSLASFRRALETKPDYVEAFDNLLFTLNYTTQQPECCLEEARKFGRMVARKVTTRYSAWQCAVHPQRLRVGMVSGDLRQHPVGYFLESLLANFDPDRIELIAYPTVMKVDSLTSRIKPYFAAWKPLFNMSDADAARLIHADGVHVLLDLSGHTGHNRLPVFAWKPAPVQAGWLGYFATTGVKEMDYVLADAVSVTDAQRGQFTETVRYLDTLICLTPPDVGLSVAALPALNNGFVTFGCFQRLDKIGDSVMSAWAHIFSVLPSARLRLQCQQFGSPEVRRQFMQRLQQFDIVPSRVTMHGAMPREAYLSAHSEVDIILDTFPYTGATTTCEALWMGVPTVSLAGDTFLARVGASVLSSAGLEEWIAVNEQEYISKAVSLAGDIPKLAALRAGLREHVLASPVFDAPRFARNLETVLWAMWKECAQQIQNPASASDFA